VADPGTLKTTPLNALHRALGAKMVPFAGYDMPVQYPTGILAEHLHTRSQAGLFDVSHMGQVRLVGRDAARQLETLVPGDYQGLALGRTRYSLLLNERAGILDDLMATNRGDHLFVVVNASNKEADVALMRDRLKGIGIEHLEDRALMALQGPAAKAVMSRLAPGATDMVFLSIRELKIGGIDALATRSGYTGEDGWEISVAARDAEALARALLAQPEVKPVGLGARDSLRLEAGLCLHGNDIGPDTTPIEADLAWTIGKRRREQGGFPGHAIVMRQLADGVARKRVGIRPEDKAPARGHTPIADMGGAVIGEITSGGFGPSVGGPVAMGYVATPHARPGTSVQTIVRGTPRPAKVVKLPFVQPNYHRG
jgi:aminomethyltransferase